MSKKIGIIDEPVQPGKSDHLDIKIHSEALIEFIEKTNTPITIGVQGEWGSGKTSLLNSIKHHFDEQNQKFLQIWINAWETSLLSTPEESLIKIIHEIIDGLTKSDTDNDRKEKIKEGAKQILRGALRIGATATLGLKAGDVAEEMWKETENSIKTLREDLQEQVESQLHKGDR